MTFSWICPFCSQNQTVIDKKSKTGKISLHIEDQAEGHIALLAEAIGCSNEDCRKTTISVSVYPANNNGKYGSLKIIDDAPPIIHQKIQPFGTSKVQPDYIPEHIREDYYEACLIVEISPKASAALSRRCLRAMISDFSEVDEPTLKEEIGMLKAAIEEAESFNRQPKGDNQGENDEQQIGFIVDIEPAEAQSLIDLIEMLFDEWYGARQKRLERIQRVTDVAVNKKEKLLKMEPKNEYSGVTVINPEELLKISTGTSQGASMQH